MKKLLLFLSFIYLFPNAVKSEEILNTLEKKTYLLGSNKYFVIKDSEGNFSCFTEIKNETFKIVCDRDYREKLKKLDILISFNKNNSFLKK